MKRFYTLCVGVLAGFLVSTQVLAAGAGAYKVEMLDAASLAVGGAVVAQIDTPASVYYNPAGMTQIKSSQISMSMALIQPKENAVTATGTKTKMQQDSFLIPSAFFVTPVNQKFSVGLGATSSWGLSTTWAQDSFTRYVATNTSLKNEDYILAGAYQVTEQFSLGLGVTIDNSTIIKEKKINNTLFGDTGDANFKLAGDNVAAGFQVSGMYKLNQRHQFGLQYVSDIRRKYHGKVHLDNLGPATQALYGFASSSYETDVVSKSTLPQSVDLGYCFLPTDKLKLSVDVMWMDWSSTKEEELAYPSETDSTGGTLTTGKLGFLNIGNPANRDWHSALSLGLGAEYDVSDRLRVRGGYYFHQSPVPQDTWQPNMPDANSHSVSTGFGYDITKAWVLDFTYSAMFYDTRSIKNAEGDSSFGSIDGKYSQWTNMVMATATYKF